MPEVVARRMELAPDGSHEHVALVGYRADQIPGEPVMITAERALELLRLPFERLWVRLPNGEEVDVVEGTCPVCGRSPYLRTKADEDGFQALLALPER
jgi:hypothetical protein